MQLFSNVIKSWKQKVKKYFFSYRNGFYELYQVANSPQLLIHNFANMPFVKHDKLYLIITTQNPFLRVKFFYLTYEEGVFLMLIYNYYRKQKMKIALSILEQNKEIMIKDLAAQLGYDRAAKFTAAFKEEMGMLPSEVMDDK